MVRFWFKEGQPTLTVEGAPLELGPTSLVLLYRHYTNQLPPTANVPSYYVLASGKQVSTPAPTECPALPRADCVGRGGRERHAA